MERNATDHRADEGHVQAIDESVSDREVGAELLAAAKRQQADQQAHREERGPHRRQLFQGDAHAGPRRREQHVERAALLLATQHAAAGQERPDRDQEDEYPDLPRCIAADGVDGDHVGIPGE
jgi:hypothetical protein